MFELGDKVLVKAVVSFYYKDNKRQYERSPDKFEAVVVGAANKPLGLYYPRGDPHEPEPGLLKVTGTVKVIKVRKRLFGREYDVHVGDLRLL